MRPFLNLFTMHLVTRDQPLAGEIHISRTDPIQNSTTAMIWRLLRIAENRFRKLNVYELLKDVYAGKKFVDGVIRNDIIAPERMAALRFLHTYLQKLQHEDFR